MKVMVIVKASKESEAGILPPKELFEEMHKFNEQLVNAGVMLEGDGLQPSSKGKRVRFSGQKPVVIDGPFAETKELVAGFWIWQVRSIDEAVEWLKKAPFGGGAEIEIRPFYETCDLGEGFSPELRDKDRRLRERIADKKINFMIVERDSARSTNF